MRFGFFLGGVGGRGGREDKGAREGEWEDARGHGGEPTAARARGHRGFPQSCPRLPPAGEAFRLPDVLPGDADQGQAPGVPRMPQGPGRGRIHRTHPTTPKEGPTEMFTPRRTLASLLVVGALGFAACGGDSDSEKLQQDAQELQEQGQQLQEDAQKAAEEVQDGTKSAEEAANEIQQGAEDLQENATDAASDAIENVQDNSNVPDEAQEALEQAQQDLENVNP